MWAWDGVVEYGREHAGHTAWYVDAQTPYSGSARQMGEHSFTGWPPFLILQVPIAFCELPEFWWVIWLCVWVAPVRYLAGCAWRGVKKARDLSASWLNRRRGNPDPRHTAVPPPWSTALTGQEPGLLFWTSGGPILDLHLPG